MKFKLPTKKLSLGSKKLAKKTYSKPKLKDSIWTIVRQSIERFRKNWKLFVILAAIVEVPSAFVRQFSSSDSSSFDFSIVLFIASMFTISALFWYIQGHTKSQKITQLYTESSKRFLPLFFLSILLTLIFLPLFGGIFLIFLTVLVGFGMIYNVIGVLLTIASVLILIRLLLSVAYVIDPRVTFKQSIALSWRYSRRRFWYIVWCVLVFLLPVSIVVGLVTYLIGLIPAIGQNAITQSTVNGVCASIFLPVLVIYWNNVAQNIKRAHEK